MPIWHLKDRTIPPAIIYQDTKLGFLNDVSNNYLQARIEAAFLSKTGSIPSDRTGWASDYSRFCTTVLAPAKVADDVENGDPRALSSKIHLALIPPIVRRRPQHSQT